MALWFHGGWLFLLVVLTARTFSRGALRPRREAVIQCVLATLVILWAARPVTEVVASWGRGVELVALRLAPAADPEQIARIGGAGPSDVVLPHSGLDDVHLLVRFPGGQGPEIWNASGQLRVEVDGVEIHDTVVRGPAVLKVGAVEVAIAPEDGGLRVGAEVLRGDFDDRLLAAVPGFGGRPVPLGHLYVDGGALKLTDERPLGSALCLRAVRTENGVRIGAVDAETRARSGWSITEEGGPTVRPAERWTPLHTGQNLAMGHLPFVVSRADPNGLELRPTSAPTRWRLSAEGFVLGSGSDALLLREHEGRLRLASLNLDAGRGLGHQGGRWVVAEGGIDHTTLAPGAHIEAPLAGGGTVEVRLSRRADDGTWEAWVQSWGGPALPFLATLYLALSVTATLLGRLHSRTTGLFHGAFLVLALGLLLLLRLSDPEPGAYTLVFARQARVAGAALAIVFVLSLWVLVAARRGRTPTFRPLSLGAAHGPWVIALALLTMQLPFGELGVQVPGLGSFQPVELARTLLVLHLGFWSARAWAAKADRLRGAEALGQRWSYLVHAAPAVVAMGLCAAVSDHSPILVFGALIVVLAVALARRPSWSLRWGALGSHVMWDAVLVAAATALVGWTLLHNEDSTAAARVGTFFDPFAPGAESEQVVAALWATASGGLWGLGWSAPHGALPPAIKDDFVLVLLAARGGALAVALLATSFAVMTASGAFALLRAAGEGRRLRSEVEASLWVGGTMLWMLMLQVGLVLGSATGGLPVVGQPLPFVAAAGSHLLFFCVPAVVVVLEAARRPIRSILPLGDGASASAFPETWASPSLQTGTGPSMHTLED